MYGAAHYEFKLEFLTEMAQFCNGTDIPCVVGGDFKILRHSGDKKQIYAPFTIY